MFKKLWVLGLFLFLCFSSPGFAAQRQIGLEDLTIGSGTYTSSSGLTVREKLNAGTWPYKTAGYTDKNPNDAVDGGHDLTFLLQNLILKGSPHHNVKAYGATGDGSTDDTAAIQAAFDAAENGVAFIPSAPSGYLCNSALTFPSNIIIYGEGAQSILKVNFTGQSTTPFLSNDDPNNGNVNIVLRDFAIDGKTPNDNDQIIRFLNVDNFLVENLYIYDVGGNQGAIDLYGDCTNGRIAFNHFKNCDQAVVVRASTSTETSEITIIGNTIEDSGVDEQIVVYGWNGEVHDVSIIGNVIDGNNNCSAGIAVLRGYRTTIVGNTIFNAEDRGIWLQLNATKATATNNHSIVANNIIHGGCAEQGMQVEESTISGGINRIIIEGNIISSVGGKGMLIKGSGYIVKGNLITGAEETPAIDFNGQNRDGNEISGNLIFGSAGGIEFSTGNGVVITGNIIGSTTGTGDGIKVLAMQNSVISNNVIYNINSGSGIHVTSSGGVESTSNIIEGNHCSGIPAANSVFRVEGASATNLIQGNVFDGTITILDNSSVTTNIYEDNRTTLTRDLASATTVTLPPDHSFINVTGSTTINTIAASWTGREVDLKFASTPTVTDGNNLKLSGDFIAVADNTLSLIYDGTNWLEISRSGDVNKGSATWDTSEIADGDEEAKEVTVTGAALGDYAEGSFSLDITDLGLNCQITATDTATCILFNNTGGTLNIASGTLRVKATKP